MTRDEKDLIKNWFDHIVQMATDRKTITGNVMDDAHCLDEIKVLGKNASDYIKEHWDNKEAWVDDTDVVVHVRAFVRYWEDATVNGKQDDALNPQMPCVVVGLDDTCWVPKIEVKSGLILNWEPGTEASIHYKVCDECELTIMKGNTVLYDGDGYVPDFLCPKSEGYGDYIIMDIDSDGFIKNWDLNKVYEFLNEQKD